MKKKVFGSIVCVLAIILACGFMTPENAFASGTKSKPVADDVQYITENGKNTGIKSITLNPYTYYNISRDEVLNPKVNGKQNPTIKLSQSLLKKFTESEIFPKWGLIAEGIFRDQANQLVTIEGSSMMKSDTSSSESFDKHFSYGKAGVSSSYSKYDWALSDLTGMLGRPDKSGKSTAEQGEFAVMQGSTNNDEVVCSGVQSIANLKGARTLMGKGLRACADDDDLSVSDFLGDEKDKSDNKFRLPALNDEKTSSGFANVVTCVNRAGSSGDYDYVTFGIAVYDFDVTPIAADKLKYIEAAQGYADIKEAAEHGVKGVSYNSSGSGKTEYSITNSSSEESTASTSLEYSESEETTATTEDTFEWGMEQEIGSDFSAGVLTDCLPYATIHVQNNFHETWSSMKGKSESKAKSWTKTVSTENTLPPHTAAVIQQNSTITSEMEDYQQPVVINYKVAIFAMSGDYFNGAWGAINSNSYDKQWMSVIFDGSDGYDPGGNNAIASLYSRAVENKDIEGYDGSLGKYRSWCDKSAWKSSSNINWDNVASGISGDSRASHIIEKKSGGGGKSTLADIASEVPFSEMASALSRNVNKLSTNIDRIIPLYDLGSIQAESSVYNMDLNRNSKLYLDTIKIKGIDEEGEEFYGFDTGWGKWELAEDYSGIKLQTDVSASKQWLNASKAGDYKLKWVLNDNAEIYTNDSPKGMDDLSAVKPLTVTIHVSSNAEDIANFGISEKYEIDYNKKFNLNQAVDVNIKDNTGRLIYVPIFWEGGSFVSANGDVKLSSPGTYRVRAYAVRDNGTKVYSNYMNLNAIGLRNIDFKKPADFDEGDLMLTKKHPARSIDLTEFVSYLDQNGSTWKGDTSEADKNMTFSVDDTDNASIENGILTVSNAGTYDVTCKTNFDYAGLNHIVEKTVHLTFTQENWLDSIEMEEPPIGKKDLMLVEKDDQIKIDGLKDLIKYYDQEGVEWEGKKPRVAFEITPNTENARIKNGTFFADAPGTYTIQAKAQGFDINPVTVVVTEKAVPVVEVEDLNNLIIDEGSTEVSAILNDCISWTTQFDGIWKDSLTDMRFKLVDDNEELADSVPGARITTKIVKDNRTGALKNESTITCTKEGEYRVRVTPEKTTVNNYNITVDDDIIVRVAKYKKVAALKLTDFSKDLDELSALEGNTIEYPLKDALKYYDKDGKELKEDTDTVNIPKVKFTVKQLTYNAQDEKSVEVDEVDGAQIDESDTDNPVLRITKAGNYLVQVKAMGDDSIKSDDLDLGIQDKIWSHEFPEKKDKDGNVTGFDWLYADDEDSEKAAKAKEAGAIAPTCEADGIRVLVSEDGTVIKDKIPACGHHWHREIEVREAPTEAKDGLTDLKCELCGKWFRDNYERDDAYQRRTLNNLPKLKKGNYDYEGAMRDEDGNLLYVNNVVDGYKRIPDCNGKLGYLHIHYARTEAEYEGGTNYWRQMFYTPSHHFDTKYTTLTAPTCTKEGSEAVQCVKCEYGIIASKPNSEKVIPRKSHEYEMENGEIKYTVVKEATCEEDGYKEAYCKKCDDVLRVKIPAIGHNWGRPTYKWSDDFSTVTATRKCSKDTCKACTETETVKTTYEITRYPTTTTMGQTTYTAVFENSAFTTQKTTETDIPTIADSENMKVLNEKKEAAKAELEAYKSDEEYTKDGSKAKADAIKEGCNAIEKAKTAEDIEKALRDAKAAVDKIRTAREEGTFEEERQNAIEAVNEIDPADYTADANKQQAISEAKENAVAVMKAAATKTDMIKAMVDLYDVVAEIAITDSEEDSIKSMAAQLKDNAESELNNYADPYDYPEEERQELENIKNDAYWIIKGAYDTIIGSSTDAQKEEAVNNISKAVRDAKAAIDELKTIADYENEAYETLLQVKQDAKKSVKNYKEIQDYRDEQQVELRQIISDAYAAINLAADEDAVAEAVGVYKARIDALKTKAELDAEEMASLKELAKEFVNSVDITDLSDEDANTVKAARTEAIRAIDSAATTGAVSEAVAVFTDAVSEAVDNRMTMLNQIKANAKTTLENYKNPDNYRNKERTDLENAVTAGKVEIDAADNAQAVAQALADAKATIDALNLKTAAQYDAEELTGAKDTALAELSEYSEDNYREADKTKFNAALDQGRENINAAADTDEVAAALREAKAAIEKIKTAAELDTEEGNTLNAAKAKAKSKLENYASSSDYDEESWATVEEMIREGKEKIDSVEISGGIDAALENIENELNAAKEKIDGVKTSSQIELVLRKMQYAAEIYEYLSDDNMENYYAEQQDEIRDIVDAACENIEKAAKATTAYSVRTKAKEAIEALPTKSKVDAENEQKKAETLEDAKEAAILELSEYKKASDYRQEERQTLSEAIATGKGNINAVEIEDGNLEEALGKVTEALEAAKAAIDEIKTDAALTDEEYDQARSEAEFAVSFIKSTFQSMDMDEDVKESVNQAAEKALAAISSAETKDAVDSAIDGFVDEMDKLMDYYDNMLEALKAELKNELNSYKDSDKYRQAEKSKLAAKVSEGKTAIAEAETTGDIYNALKDAKAAIDEMKLKTASEYEDEEKKAEEEKKKAEEEKKKEEETNKIPSEITPASPANIKAVETLILKSNTNKDIKGSTYSPLKVKSKKQTKKSIKLTWSKAKGAQKYVIYGNAYGKKNKMKKIATTKARSFNVKMIAGKKLKKGVYYKFIVVAQKGDKAVAVSKTTHVSTAGKKKKANPKGVMVKKSIIAKAKKLKKGKTLTLKAKVTKKKKTKVVKCASVRYESSNKKIATVTSKGKVKGIKKGNCCIYAYAQNGIAKKIKVVVK